MTNQTLINEVTGDTVAAHAAGVNGTPAIILSGAGGPSSTTKTRIPTSAPCPASRTVQQLITQVS